MATPWWAKVSADYYKRPSHLAEAIAPRARKMAAVIADSHLRDEPQLAGVFLNTNVPYSIAQRTARQYGVVKAQATGEILNKAGLPNQLTNQQQKAITPPPTQPPEDTGNWWGDMWGGIGDAAGAVGDSLKSGFNLALEGINEVFSPIQVPFSAGRANQQAPNANNANVYALLDRERNGDKAAGDEAARLIGDPLSNAPLTVGLRSVLGTQPLSGTQQEDMRRAGYDPNSFADRYGWYYDAMEAGQRAVADDDVRTFSQEFDPQKVQAVREIITSNALNDGVTDALSPHTQEFLAGLQTDNADPRDKELFDRMTKSATLRPGSLVADMLGLERGSDSANIASAFGDLAFYWYADPIALGAKGLQAYRIANRGVPAADITALENKLVAVRDPSNLSSKPQTVAGKNMDELLDAVDNVHVLTNTKFHSPEMQVRAGNEAAQTMSQFFLRHPDMVNHWDIIAKMRAGKVEFVRPRTGQDLEVNMAAAAKGEPYDASFIKFRDTPGVPTYVLDRSAPDVLQRTLNEARGEIVPKMSTWIWHDAVAQGRPLVGSGILLMPGEVAVNRRVRAWIAPYRDKAFGVNSRLFDVVNGKHPMPNVQFDQTFDKLSDMFIGRPGGQWSAANYTSKLQAGLERTLSRYGNTYSGMRIPLDGPESLKTIRRMAISMFGRRYAESIAIKWAQAGPGERKGILDQFHEAFAEAALFKTNPQGRMIYDMFAKGIRPDIDQPWRVANEVYTANKADNAIKIGNREAAAGVWDYQMSRGTIAPDYMAVRAAQQKFGVLANLTGLFNNRLVHYATSLWKVGKVGNSSNMGRQAIEGYGLLAGDQGLRRLYNAAWTNRRYVVNQTVKGRREVVQLGQASSKIVGGADTKDIQELQRLSNVGDWSGYRTELERIGTSLAGRHGLTDEQVHAIANLSEGVKIEDLHRSSGGMFFGGLIDPLRKTRLAWQARTGVKDPFVQNPYHNHLDDEFQDGLLKGALNEFGTAADNALLLQGGRVTDDLTGAARLGIGGTPSRIPNSRQWLGAQGDAGAMNWFKEFDSRQTDVLGGEVMRALAIEARHSGSATIADIMNQAANRAARARNGALPEVLPSHLNTAEDIARWLLRDGAAGSRFRIMADRLAYDDVGGRIKVQGQQTQWDAAVDRAVQVQLRDAARHTGASIDPNTGAFHWDAAYNPMLDNLAVGGRVKLDDLHAIDDRLRPTEISAPLYVPNIGKVTKGNIVDKASKLYAFTVARPLQRLMINPVFIANKNVIMREMEPVANELIARGFTARESAAFLEDAATKYAIKSTFRYTDEVAERSFFSEISSNFLMFQRAGEDFLKRFMRVTAASPQILSRGYMLMEAGQHSGMIYPGPPEDDDQGNGELKQHLVFTFPGSELMAQGVQEAGRALGWGDSDLIQRAIYSSMSSQVRYVNPSLSNPFGFSTSPMIGMPLRIIRYYYPSSDEGITDFLAHAEGGGERFFAEQGVIPSLLPTPLARLVPALTQDEQDGQLASAVRNAFIYLGASGHLPGQDATADEVEDAHDAVKAMATNQLVWRAIVGSFSPWAPQYNEPKGLDLPPVNVFDQARGIGSLRGEWFDILGQMSRKFGAENAFGQAATEWFRRHPDGQSILKPEAFQVGTTDNPGSAGNAPNANSGPQLTKWMIDNKDWILSHKSVAYYLLPNFAEAQFSSQGMNDQVRFELREHKDGKEFYDDLRYQMAMREYWQMVNKRSAELASPGRDKQRVYQWFDDWEKGWRIAHPASAAEKDRRMNPEYVKGTLAPALQKIVEQAGPAPSGVDLTVAKSVWQHYSDYQAKYNKTVSGDKGKYDRAHLNKEYRDDGNKKFLGTPAETLWKAMDIYEDGN